MVDLPKKKVGIVACSGEELAGGTVTRLGGRGRGRLGGGGRGGLRGLGQHGVWGNQEKGGARHDRQPPGPPAG